jgi:Family of unknown function (DUF6328)
MDAHDRDAKHDGRDETVAERADRNFVELLQELRVAQTGVQILFAFLLTLPFTQRFGVVDTGQKAVYLATMVCAALSMACLVAPVSQHRIVFGRGLKASLVLWGNRLAHAGLAFLLLAVVGALFLIIDVVAGAAVAWALCAVVTLAFVLAWYVQPLRHRLRRDPGS